VRPDKRFIRIGNKFDFYVEYDVQEDELVIEFIEALGRVAEKVPPFCFVYKEK